MLILLMKAMFSELFLMRVIVCCNWGKAVTVAFGIICSSCGGGDGDNGEVVMMVMVKW